MVKGCQRKTIHIRDTGSRYYEEAYFILKPGVCDTPKSEADMIDEAMRIANESLSDIMPQKRKIPLVKKGPFVFALGVFCGFLTTALSFAIYFVVR